MIQKYMTVFLDQQAQVKALLAEEKEWYIEGYKKIAAIIVLVLAEHCKPYDHEAPVLDPERIQEIDWGDYQGTLLYIVGAEGYQPSTFFSMVVSYGSCSGCDTLQSVLDEDDPIPGLFDLARNMLSSIHKIQGGLY